jgi:hypothetical protein
MYHSRRGGQGVLIVSCHHCSLLSFMIRCDSLILSCQIACEHTHEPVDVQLVDTRSQNTPWVSDAEMANAVYMN